MVFFDFGNIDPYLVDIRLKLVDVRLKLVDIVLQVLDVRFRSGYPHWDSDNSAGNNDQPKGNRYYLVSAVKHQVSRVRRFMIHPRKTGARRYR